MFGSSWPTVALVQKGKRFSLLPIRRQMRVSPTSRGCHYPSNWASLGLKYSGRNAEESLNVRGHPLWNEIRSHKALNYNKVKGIIQKREENPIAFYDRLEEAFRKYTTLDPESVEGAALLNYHFVN
jgi:hypothetical protein